MAFGLIVRVAGRRLDHLRNEAARLSRSNKADWSIEPNGFEDLETRHAFALVCKTFAVPFEEA